MASPQNQHAEKNHLPEMIQRLYQRISPDWTNFDAPWDPKTTTKQQRTDWMANRIKAYVDRDLKGKDLYIIFREDFEDWNLHAFNESDLEVRRELRNFLRQRGINFSVESFTSMTAIAKILWKLISDGHPDFEADEPSWIPRAANVNPRPWTARVVATAMPCQKMYSRDEAERIVRQAVENYYSSKAVLLKKPKLEDAEATSPGQLRQQDYGCRILVAPENPQRQRNTLLAPNEQPPPILPMRPKDPTPPDFEKQPQVVTQHQYLPAENGQKQSPPTLETKTRPTIHKDLADLPKAESPVYSTHNAEISDNLSHEDANDLVNESSENSEEENSTSSLISAADHLFDESPLTSHPDEPFGKSTKRPDEDSDVVFAELFDDGSAACIKDLVGRDSADEKRAPHGGGSVDNEELD
ncbi:hypothetical protein E4U14_001162, partial [Claviceps sp. LM454 group G7]